MSCGIHRGIAKVNVLTVMPDRRVSTIDIAKNWVVSYLGNLCGSLFFACIIVGYGGVFQETPEYSQAAIQIAIQKAQLPQWHQIFLRGIGANWLVCFAVFISISSRDIASKIIAIWWPTATFVALALDHVIANMFFIPMGIWCGAPFGPGYYIWKSMIPTALGNFVGGGVFVGATYWYLYLTGEAGVQVDFNVGSLATAMEAGGPMRKTESEQQTNVGESTMIGVGSNDLPHSGGQLNSSLSQELGDHTPYAKSHAERMSSPKSSSADEKV